MQSLAQARTYHHRPARLLLLRETIVEDREHGGRRLSETASVAGLEPESVSDWKQAHARLVSLGAAGEVARRPVAGVPCTGGRHGARGAVDVRL